MPPSISFGKLMGVPYHPTMITQLGRGRGTGTSIPFHDECLCNRPHAHLLCHVCGYIGWGRLRYSCPQHPQTIFLIDMSQCPKCRAYAFMMTEF